MVFALTANWKDGDIIPGYVLKEGNGSRADVATMATYTDGTWIVEFQRSLITNNPDDVQFE
ncbi:MAG: hypothetical protein ACE5KP_01675 [Dehalococcoidales bacterium]